MHDVAVLVRTLCCSAATGSASVQSSSMVSQSTQQSHNFQAPRTRRMALLEAEDQKQLGDQAYKASCFTQAITYYTAAISLGGDSQTIYSNRSASSFESGDYTRSLEDATTAFELDAASALASKVALRAARACFWSANFDSARSWLSAACNGACNAAVDVLQAQLGSAEEPWPAYDSSASALRQVPMNRPAMQSDEHSASCLRISSPRSLLSGASSAAPLAQPRCFFCRACRASVSRPGASLDSILYTQLSLVC